MQPYPNYSQMNNPYSQMNNMYAQPNNPYADRMNFLQNYQQSLQQPMSQTSIPGASQQMNVIGKIVDSIDVVKATDVPMDGSIYYFPKADGTEIFGKQWLPNGQTRILTFKPYLDTEPNNVSNADEKLKFVLSEEATEVFMKRFDDIEKRLDEFIGKKTSNRVKKEAESE